MGSYADHGAPLSRDDARAADPTRGRASTGKSDPTVQPSSLTRRNHRIGFVQRVLGLALLAAVPALALALALFWTGNFSSQLQWSLTVFIALFWLVVALVLRHQMEMPLRTLSNLISTLREGDYSFRARGSQGDDPLAEVMREANALINILYEQRLGAMEATTLLRKVMEEIDVAVFAFGPGERLELVDRAGEG